MYLGTWGGSQSVPKKEENNNNPNVYRRRINTEEKAKIVATVWGTEFIKFLALPPYSCCALGRIEQ